MNPFTAQGLSGTEGDLGWIAFMVVLVVAILAFVVLQAMNHRRRIAEARLKTVEYLARQGELTESQLRELVAQPARTGRRFFYAVGWILMVGGIFGFCMSAFTYYDSRSWFMVGFVSTFVSTAIFATPFMFRELEKQGWI